MARVVVVALVWCSARADEYGGAGMPLYGAEGAEYAAAPLAGGGAAALDYRGHSPDAPAPLDYKYEEEPQGNTEKTTRDAMESDAWKKSARKQRGLRRDRDELSVEGVDVTELDLKLKPSRRRPRPARPAPHTRSRRGRRQRSRDVDPQPMDYLDRRDYRIDKNKNLEEDIDTFTAGETTERINRRKPRDFDRYLKPLKNDDLESEDEFIADRKLKGEQSMEHEELGRRSGKKGGRARQRFQDMGAPPPAPDDYDDEDERPRPSPPKPPLPADYHHYSDYYDMRRLHNIKNQLPMLLRRTTMRARTPLTEGSTVDLLALLLTARRALATPAARPAGAGADLADPMPIETTTSTSTSTTDSKTSVETSARSTSELSIAEKSRLSILKKSQKKEHDKGEPSKKPPVLLQVTSKLPTVVMVEPATSADPWLRARLVSDDSPRQLDKVKRLMRHKLVAGAKSIQDLTDNWDEMVCDYIDVSLLDAAALHNISLPIVYVTLAFVYLMR